MNSYTEIPILLLVYNRTEKFKKLIDSLRSCELSETVVLNIFSDAPKNDVDEIEIKALRAYCRNIQGFYRVILHERKNNLGGLINGAQALTHMSANYSYFIILEDDNVVHPMFLKSLRRLSEKYHTDSTVSSISLYNTPNFEQRSGLYLSKIFNGWGVLVWSHKPYLKDLVRVSKPYSDMVSRKLNKEVKKYHPKLPRLLKLIDSGLGLTDYHATYLNIRNNTYQIRSFSPMILNSGFDGTGERCGIDERFNIALLSENSDLNRLQETYELENDITFYRFFHPKKTLISALQDIFRKLMNLIKRNCK